MQNLFCICASISSSTLTKYGWSFWPTSKRKVFKTNSLFTVASAQILTLGQFSAVLAQCAVEIQKKIIRMFLGTFWVNDYKTKKFSHAHSGLQSDKKQISVKSRQIMSKATMCRHSSMVDTTNFSLPAGTSGQVGLMKSPIKLPYHKIIS